MSIIVLTNTYQFWEEIGKKKAIKKIVNGKAKVLISSDKILWKSKNEEFKEPLIIQLLNFSGNIKWKSDEIPFTNKLVFERDDNYCQYWHDYKLIDGIYTPAARHKYRCTANDRTVDHIIPKSLNGKNTFNNTVTCCKYCNEILKKNRLPEEAGLELIKHPSIPKRKKGDTIIKKFLFNPNLPSHNAFIEMCPHYK